MTTQLLNGRTTIAGNPGEFWRLRQEPALESESIGVLASGTWVTVIDGGRVVGGQEWWRVRVGGDNAPEGWIAASGLVGQRDEEQVIGGQTLVGGAGNTGPWNLRDLPGLVGNVTGMLEPGILVSVFDGPVREDRRRWWYVRSDGEGEGSQLGWIRNSGLRPQPLLHREIIRAAMAQVGYDPAPASRNRGAAPVTTVVRVERVMDNHARVTLLPVGRGEPDGAVIRREDGVWRYLARFSPPAAAHREALYSLGVPRELWE